MRFLGFILVITAAVAIGCFVGSASADDEVLNPLVAQDCASCHGSTGEGNDQLKGPAIAGLPAWYVTLALEKFRKHARGIDPEDREGTQMHAMSLAMTVKEIKEVAEFAAKQKPSPGKATIYGNAVRGKILYVKYCLECHGADAAGIEEKKAPPLVGYQDWYVVSQLKKFRSGSRGVHPLDTEGIEMHKVAKNFSGEQDVNDVAAYVCDLAGK